MVVKNLINILFLLALIGPGFISGCSDQQEMEEPLEQGQQEDENQDQEDEQGQEDGDMEEEGEDIDVDVDVDVEDEEVDLAELLKEI